MFLSDYNYHRKLKEELNGLKKEMRNQAKQLESMKTLQQKEHKENLMLKQSAREKQRRFERVQEEMIAQKKKLEDKIDMEKKGNARILKKLLVRNSSTKQELKQAQEHASSLQAELNKTSAEIERSSQQIHSLQSTLQEKERANESLLQKLSQAQGHADSLQAELDETRTKAAQQKENFQRTLQKNEREFQQTLQNITKEHEQVSERLTRGLSSMKQELQAAKQARDQLRKWSTCLGCGGVVVLMLAILIPTILISLQVITPLMGMCMNAYKINR